MIWLKSVLAGLVAALLTIVVIVSVFTVTIVSMSQGAGSGGIGFVSGGVSELIVLPVVIAFALGFWWMFRRQRRGLGI